MCEVNQMQRNTLHTNYTQYPSDLAYESGITLRIVSTYLFIYSTVGTTMSRQISKNPHNRTHSVPRRARESS